MRSSTLRLANLAEADLVSPACARFPLPQNGGQIIECLPTCLEDGKAKYPPVTTEECASDTPSPCLREIGIRTLTRPPPLDAGRHRRPPVGHVHVIPARPATL